jgi:DNA-binding response OmpR family regulator
MMTGCASRDDFRRGMVCGADDYLQKPFTPDELVEAVLSRLIRQTDLELEAYNHAYQLRADFDPHVQEAILPAAVA